MYIGKIVYALLFCAALPILLAWWAMELTVGVPVDPSWKTGGEILVVSGALLMTEAMWRLWKNGKGLPMNAFPPTQYVQRGSYRLFHHPIYFGFCISCAGISILFMSPAGLYVLTPVMVILCFALVFGYENLSLKKRFGLQHHSTFFGLASDVNERADLLNKIGAFCSVFIPWFISYQWIIYMGASPNSINTVLSFEKNWSVAEIAVIPYTLTYLFVGLMPFIIRYKNQLRAFQLHAWWLTGAGIFFQFTIPFYAAPRTFKPQTWLGDMILIEQSYDGVAGAFPSFHVLWALLSVMVWSQTFPKGNIVWRTLGVSIILSCVGIGVHSLLDVVAAFILFIAVINREHLWRLVNKGSETLANSWREWHFESFRIINHSAYSAAAAATGVLFLYQFGVSVNTILIIAFLSLVGGALWGQLVEGSSRLLRPFGFYGALLGGLLGLLLCKILFGQSMLVNAAAIALVVPWVQAIGRLRCLVQGCCHGRITGNNNGIRYINMHSRVCDISGLRGRKIHNTPLYSIAFNVITALILFRIWYAGAGPALLTGLYFILSGAARFVEEAYRGEPQTKIIGGLRMYQWIAIASVLAGIVISTFESGEVLTLRPTLNVEVILTGLAAGLGWAFALSMDFPKSTIRFSRLSG